MKSKVHFSLFCKIITIAVFAALIGATISSIGNTRDCAILSAITLLAIFSGLYYCPTAVSATTAGVTVHRCLSGDKVFRYSDIKKVDTFYPSAGGLRLCGSGGFFGYWGYFSDILIGQYFGYYADRNQCFYIVLKNNRQYVISCNNHTEMVKTIQQHLKP